MKTRFFKALVSGWMLLAALLACRPGPSAAEEAVWLTILEVNVNIPNNPPVRIFAGVNGTRFTPSGDLSGWLPSGSGAKPVSVEIPSSETFALNFEMETPDGRWFKSQDTVVIKKVELPAPRSYRLFGILNGVHGIQEAAVVNFVLANTR